MGDITLQQVLHAGFTRYCATYGSRPSVWTWAYSVLSCRTSVLGGHVWRCPEGHEQAVVWNSCKHRACPQCAALAREQWLEGVRRRLSLNCGYHHVVFTVPHELHGLWSWNRSWFADQVLGSSRETMLQLLGQERWLGALAGMVQTWQTWGRDGGVHLHTHMLLTAGGWTPAGWKPLKHDYVAPTKVLRGVYRGKLRSRLLAGLSSGEMVLPTGWSAADVHRLLKRLYRKEWCVHVQPRYAYGEGVMTYLGRYVRGGPLREHQLLSLTETEVTFRYTDHRDHRSKPLRLPIEAFIHRLSEHVPDPGFHVVRYAGLYAPSNRDQLAQARAQLGMEPSSEPAPLTAQDYLERVGHGERMRCSVCGQRYVQQEKIERSGRSPPLQEYRRAA